MKNELSGFARLAAQIKSENPCATSAEILEMIKEELDQQTTEQVSEKNDAKPIRN